MTRTTRIVLCLMLALSLGLHWTVLQSVAWMGMLVKYSANVSFSEAIVQTFDGNHPCTLCVAVDEGKQAGKEQQSLTSTDKIDWLLTTATVALHEPDFSLNRPGLLPLPPSRVTAPPGPPPRQG